MGAPLSADDLISGCEKFTTATARAHELMTVVSGKYDPAHREFRVGASRAVLAILLHAAALGGIRMQEVWMWLADPDAAREQIQRFLQCSTEPRYTFNSLLHLYGPPTVREATLTPLKDALGQR